MDRSTRNRVYRPGNSQAAAAIRESIRNASARKRVCEVPPKKRRDRPLKDCEVFLDENAKNALDGEYDERCSFLNGFLDLIEETCQNELDSADFFDATCKQLLEFLKDDHPCIRAMCFHILRKLAAHGRNLVTMLTTHVDIYVVRSLDLKVENESERKEALMLISKMISIYSKSNLKKLIDSSAEKNNGKKFAFPKSIMQPVISIALAGINPPTTNKTDERSKDKMSLPCIGMFCEFCLLEPFLVLDMAGTDWIVRVLTGEAGVSRRIATVVANILATWLDDPKIRSRAHLHLVLEQIFAPLIEYGFFEKQHLRVGAVRQLEDVLDNFKFAFLCVLRSWAGLFACAAVGPSATIIASSPLRLLEYLGLGTVGNDNLQRLRDMIVDICCDFVDLPYASKKFTSWEDALRFYQSMHLADTYQSSIKNDFVVAENEARLANDHMYTDNVDLLSSFRSLAQFVLINASLPQSLARLIIANPDSPSAIKATLLLADMLRAAPSLLPTCWRASVLSMPTLVQSACESLANSKAAAAIHDYSDEIDADQYTFVHAENAELVLHRFDRLNVEWIRIASGAIPETSFLALFLPQALTSQPPSMATSENVELANDYHLSHDDYDYDVSKPTSTESFLYNDADSEFGGEDEEDGINWLYIETVLRITETEKLVSSSSIANLILQVLTYVNPLREVHITNRRHVLLAKLAIKRAIEVIEYAKSNSTTSEFKVALFKYASDFRTVIEKTRDDPRSRFSVRNLSHTGAMFHFAIIGGMSSHPIGVAVLQETGVLPMFIDLMDGNTAGEYVKLAVSCLDYSIDGLSRVVLTKALTATHEDSRRWATRFLGVLASLSLPNFAEWGLKLMVRQLADKSVKVVRQAIQQLHIWLPAYGTASKHLLHANWSPFGDAAVLLRVHAFSDENTFDSAQIECEVDFWMQEFNLRYLNCVEEDMREALLGVRRSIDGSFSRYSCERSAEQCCVRPPPHLFASLARHESGLRVLRVRNVCQDLLHRISSDNVADVKSSLLALGHVASVDDGCALLLSTSEGSISRMIRLAEESSILSIRGIAYWALTLASMSKMGARYLATLGWESNRHRQCVDEAKRRLLAEEREREKAESAITSWAVALDRPRSRTTGYNTPCHLSSHKLRRTKSDEAVYKDISVCSHHHTEAAEQFESFVAPRVSRATTALTIESTSQLDDGTESRRRATTMATTASVVDEVPTVARCIQEGLNATRAQLFAECERVDAMPQAHFASRNRERHRLSPMPGRTSLKINRNVGDPVRYCFMSKDEERNFANYRRVVMGDSWLCEEFRKEDDEAVSALSALAVHVVALPAEVEVMCGNIFPSKHRFEQLIGGEQGEDEDVEDRGAKSGHGRSQRKTDAAQPHSVSRCFYCNLPPSNKTFILPKTDVALLRREVLAQVDMLEIKEALPEKHLLALRAQYEWLFRWPCLYADVLELLDEFRFKPQSRSFLQQLFYDALLL